MLISRKRDGKPRMIAGQFVVVRVGVHQLASLLTQKNYTGSEKQLPTFIKEERPLWHGVP
jgi:hypothetical protein